MKFKPHEYQLRAIDFIKYHPYCALFLDMGLGKTVSTLTAISEMQSTIDVERVLVVAPKKVAESTWAQECQKWDHLKHLRVSIVLGNERQRLAALAADADIYVTSRDLFAWLVESKKFDFDTVVLDEMTSFKSSTSQRFKAFRKIRPNLTNVIGLTGTPAPNGYKDLWAQIYCLDMGERLGRAKTKFMDNYFYVTKVNHIPIKITLKPGADKTIINKISDITLSMKAKDYLNLPPLIEINEPVQLSYPVMKKYRRFEWEKIMEFADGVAIADNAAALTSKLGQYANGAMYTEDGKVETIHEEKMDRLMELIEAAHESGESVLVFYQYKHDYLRALNRGDLKHLECRLYEGDADLVDWNAGKVDVLFAHPASTGYGLNLQQGGHVVIWYGTGFNSEYYLQGNARLCRQGQTHPTRVYKLYCKGTVDESAAWSVNQKIATQDAMLAALKERIKEYKSEKHE